MRDYKAAFMKFKKLADFMREKDFSKSKNNLGRHLGEVAIIYIEHLEEEKQAVTNYKDALNACLDFYVDFVKDNNLEERFEEYRVKRVAEHLTEPNSMLENADFKYKGEL